MNDGVGRRVGGDEPQPESTDGGVLVDVNTDAVRAAERASFWRDSVLRRNDFKMPDENLPFRARLRRLALDSAELVEHASDAVTSMRSQGRTRMDGGDDIAIELMREGNSLLDHNGEKRLRSGDLYIVDYARPIQIMRPRHRASGIVLSRRRVMEVLGEDLGTLAGRRVPAIGLAAVLRHQMMSTIDEASHLLPGQRRIAITAAAEMALSILQTMQQGGPDAERFATGSHAAAMRYIMERSGDPELSPHEVARAIGCSRAALYRVFAARDEGVAETIWRIRIERAHRLLISAETYGLTISNVAQLCGFRELPSFSRMFRRRYGVTPGEARSEARR